MEAVDLAGYRKGPLYIRRSMHVPPPRDAVLGHFVFVYIHPYMDGNGRVGRFLMNVMLAWGGYPWTIVPVDRRDHFMVALESASVDQNIAPFAQFLAGLVQDRLDGKARPAVPAG